MALITGSGSPFILSSRNTGGNVSKRQEELSIFRIISAGSRPALCKRRISPLRSTLFGGWGPSVCAPIKEQLAARKAATTKKRLHFM